MVAPAPSVGRVRTDDAVLDAFFQRAGDGAMVVNRLRKVVAMNPAASAMTGWNERDLQSISCRAFGCRDEKGRPTCQESCLAQRCVESGQSDGPRCMRMARADGQPMTVEATFVPLNPQDRRTGTCMVVLRDISLLAHLDGQLRQREAEIAERNVVLKGLAEHLSTTWRAALIELRAGVDTLMNKHAHALGDQGAITASRVAQSASRVENTFAELRAQIHATLHGRR
jgi:PAS domain S-box-containing protein